MIHRDPSKLTFDCIQVPSGKAVAEFIAAHRQAGLLAVADLSLGAWRSHQVARELAGQLDLELPFDINLPRGGKPGVPRWLSYADLIGATIENEAKGRRPVLHAKPLAEAFVERFRQGSPALLAIIAPRFNLPWDEDNLQFLYFLRHGLAGTAARLVILRADDRPNAGLPDNWPVTFDLRLAGTAPPAAANLASIIPSTISPALAELVEDHLQLGDLIELPNEHRVVPPEWRCMPSLDFANELDELAQSAAVPRWLRAYAQSWGRRNMADEFFLLQQSWQAFNEGGRDLALRLVASAVECATDETARAIFEVQQRGMQLAMYRFAEAAQQAAPSALLPRGLRAFLTLAKGWGLTMSGHPADGCSYLSTARDLLKDRAGSLEYLYLLNKLASSHADAGNFAESMALELHIRETLEQQDVADYRIRYTNSICLAHLCMRQGNFGQARKYYEQAFQATLGTRTEGERVYTNACLARLAAKQDNRAEAFLYWFRAALHFAACQVPEAICVRYVAAVLDQPDRDLDAIQPAVLVEQMAARFAHLLTELAPPEMRSLLGHIEGAAAPVFLADDEAKPAAVAGQALSAIGGPGWSALIGDAEVLSAFDGACHRALRALLASVAAALSGDHRAKEASVYVVDSKRGCEMGTDLRAVVETCVRRHVPEIRFGTEGFQLSSDSIQELELGSTVRPSPAVHKIKLSDSSATVEFKRFFPQAQFPDKFRLFRAAEGQHTLSSVCAELSDGLGPEQLVEEALKLQTAGVLSLELADDWRNHLRAPQ